MARPKKKKAPPQPPPCTATSSTSSAIDPPAESQAAASDIDVQENQSDIVPTTPSISLSQATRGSELGKQPSNTENDSDQPSKKRSRGRCNIRVNPNPTQTRPRPELPIVGFGFGQPFGKSDPTRPNPACTLGRVWAGFSDPNPTHLHPDAQHSVSCA
ncbi:hypothetical protein PGT21_032357 [Puccinia graminis f. sp. tritici]|uniref:Uncharacterized protein n=1 Tax=Puccinia graminis f. sp. tritici TaxID=56615 RepID=A0A5B0P7A7_PUCGR|nr:hypothetical protein PGT21_032357 [Puccinia graminis f. sp. tritici]